MDIAFDDGKKEALSEGLPEGATLPETWSTTENVVPTPHVGGYPGGHAPNERTVLSSSFNPAAWLFSGWNCTATRFFFTMPEANPTP